MSLTATSPAVPVDDVSAEKAIVRKVAWRLMPLIMVCYLFAFFDRINISFAKFQLQADLSLSDTAYGLGAGLFVVGYVLFEVPSNMMLYKVGARRWIARIMMSWGIATALMMFVTTEWQFYVLRFVIGAMEAGFAPGVLYYLTLWFPQSYRGRITSTLFLASAFAGLIGAPVSGLVLGHMDGLLDLRGWHWLFLVGGIPCLLLGVMVLKMLHDRVEDAPWLSADEKTYLSSRIASHEANKHGSLLSAIKLPGFLLLGLIYFLIQVASYGLNFWAPQLIRSSGIDDPMKIGFMTAIPYICGAISMAVVGRLSDATGERRKFVCGLVVAGALGFFSAAVFAHHVVLLMASLALLGAGIVASIPAFWALPPKLLAGAGAGAAGGIALINTLGQFGGIVSPVMVGYIRDMTGSTTPALYVIGVTSLVAASLLFWALPERLRSRDKPGV
ncbi:MFS transporter [Pseudomonas sp. JDS28PS106]|uniref:MFS transporter n=1 Tax=Pseudomonas sp. JDS28PS106 TaxID=2497235 RepID=UPI002FD248A4